MRHDQDPGRTLNFEAKRRALLDDAALELRRVADAGVWFDQSWQVFGAMDDRVVLDIGAVTDPDQGLIGSQDSAKPYARVCPDLDVSDEDSGGCDVSVGMNRWAFSAELELHWPL